MELRRVAGALLRSPSLASSNSSSFLRIRPGQLRSAGSIEARSLIPLFSSRAFSTSPSTLSDAASNSGTSTQSTPEQPSAQPSQSANTTTSQAPSSNAAKPSSDTTRYTENERYTSLFDSIISPPSLKSSASNSNSNSNRNATPYDRSTFGANFSRPPASEHKDILSLLQSAARNTGSSAQHGPSGATASIYESLIPPPGLESSAPRAYPALGPSLGRSVEINTGRGVDLAKGLRRLDVVLAQNRVRADFNRQRFHERPGLKRKRLKSERWRKRFKEGFRYVTARVNALRQQGW